MKITEKNFLSQLRQKNPQAIEYIVEEYGGLIKAVLLANLCGRKEQWEECFNDVLLALWNNGDRFDRQKEAQFKGWLCAVAKYKAIDLLRREKEHLHLVSYEEGLAAGAFHEVHCGMNGSTGDDAENFEEPWREELDTSAMELNRLLACLTEADRRLFIRRYVEEESIEEITADTGMSRDAVYARLSRGRRKIRANFETSGGEHK